MENNITLLAFGTFGSPNGFTQTAFYGNKNINLRVFDLNTNAIKLFPNTNLTVIRKEEGGLSYALYSFAREKGSSRGGTFIGAALYYEGYKAKENLSTDILIKFHTHLKNENTDNEEIKVNHSNDLKTVQPQDFDKLTINANERIPTTSFTKKHLVIYDQNGAPKLDNYLEKSILLFPKYDTIYFTADEQIANFVKERGLFSLKDCNGFEQEIKVVKQEKEKRIQQTHSKLNQSIKTSENDENSIIQNMQKEIESQRKKHEENAIKIKESEDKINKISQIYQEYRSKINELINELKETNATDTITQKEKSLKANLDNKIHQLKQISSIKTISSPPHYNQPQTTRNDYNNEKHSESEYIKKQEQKWFKIASFSIISLIIVLIAFIGWGYSKYTELKEDYQNLSKQQKESTNTAHTYEDQESIKYDFLDSISVDRINKDLKIKNDRISNVVALIFEQNPKDVKSYFEDKKQKYSEALYNENANCFVIKNIDTIIIEKLKKIPKGKDENDN